jgi:hypothetical protein
MHSITKPQLGFLLNLGAPSQAKTLFPLPKILHPLEDGPATSRDGLMSHICIFAVTTALDHLINLKRWLFRTVQCHRCHCTPGMSTPALSELAAHPACQLEAYLSHRSMLLLQSACQQQDKWPRHATARPQIHAAPSKRVQALKQMARPCDSQAPDPCCPFKARASTKTNGQAMRQPGPRSMLPLQSTCQHRNKWPGSDMSG